MGLMLSILVVCVGVLEAISCFRHFQNGYLPFWLPDSVRPMLHERARRKTNDEDDSSDSSDELTRILHNGGGVKLDRAESPSYGLTPILAEHRRNTPILRDEDADGDSSKQPKYVENNIDDSCSTNIHGCVLTDTFRPISPSDLEEVPDGSYVSAAGKFLEPPTDSSTPQRSSSEETLHESEPEDEVHSLRDLAKAACPVDESNKSPKRFENVEVKALDSTNTELDEVVFQIDRAASPVVTFSDLDPEFSKGQNIPDLPENVQVLFDPDDLIDEDDVYLDDPIYNLLAASANILHNDAKQYADAPYIPRVSPENVVSRSSCRPLSIDSTARIPTPQTHRESMPFDLLAAHGISKQSSSRPLNLDTSASIPSLQVQIESIPDELNESQENVNSSAEASGRIPTPQAHRQSMPFDFKATQDAHQSFNQPPNIEVDHSIPTLQTDGQSMPADWNATQDGHQSSDRPLNLQVDQSMPTLQTDAQSMPVDWNATQDGHQSSDRLLNLQVDQIIPTPQLHRKSMPFDFNATQDVRQSPNRPLNLEVNQSIPTPQLHRKSMPFDWNATEDAHQSSIQPLNIELIQGIPSVPGTPSTPMKSKADISWPVFHPEPVIKRPLLALSDHNRDDSIEEDIDPSEGEVLPPLKVPASPVSILKSSLRKSTSPPKEVTDVMILTSKKPSEPKIPLENLSLLSKSSIISKDIKTTPKRDSIGVEDECSQVAIRSLSAVPSTPFMTVAGKPCLVSHKSRTEDHIHPSCHTSVDKFGRITCQPHRPNVQRRKSLEHIEVGLPLKDSALSKSLPDFFFEENVAKLQGATSATSLKEVSKKDDDDTSDTVSLGKDITPKESSIKRRQSYRHRKRHTSSTSSSKSPDHIPPVPISTAQSDRDSQQSEAIAEFENEGGEENKQRVTIDKVEAKTEAILNKELVPEEILHQVEEKPETSVFATKSQQAKTKLKKPPKTESFEEAPVTAQVLSSTLTTSVLERGVKKSEEITAASEKSEDAHKNKRETVKTPDQVPSDIDRAHHLPQTTEQSPPLPAPPSKTSSTDTRVRELPDDSHSNETKPNNDKVEGGDEEEEEEDIEYIIEDESESSNVNVPQQQSSQAPFWLIFSGEYTKAMSKDWHSGHFCCWQCDESLTGQRYVLRDDHPYCIKCYESVFANMCEECSKTIGIDSKDLSYKDKHWHEACFLCNKCRVSLVDKQFGSKADKIYCGNCYDAQFASRCDGCGEIFRAGTKKMEYKTRQWHEKCFCCCVCKSAIGTKSFIPREQEIYCATCYEEKFATRCVKCNKIITSGGVTYKNEPWHRECFTCTNCNTSLAGQRFTSRDEKPYCADCFGELFAKRCTACVKPITGIGGTRFISFEDRHWHNDCFICASCKTSLVGRGFITDAEDIICPECAKQKLM